VQSHDLQFIKHVIRLRFFKFVIWTGTVLVWYATVIFTVRSLPDLWSLFAMRCFDQFFFNVVLFTFILTMTARA